MNAHTPINHRGRPRGTPWPPERIQRLCDLIADGKTFEEVADELECSRNAIAGRIFTLRKRGDPRMPATLPRRSWGHGRAKSSVNRHLPRHRTPKPAGKGLVLREQHAAVVEGRTLFPGTVASPAAVKNILKEGGNQSKLGPQVTKGAWKGMPIFALTLEERATCPRTCQVWSACYGNGMPRAQRIDHRNSIFHLRLEAELYRIAAHHADGFVVRLHILGDFYSAAYVAMWAMFLAQFPGLRVFGYTANEPASDIGARIVRMNERFEGRCLIRFSGHADGEGPTRGTVVVERAELVPPGAVVCPAATGRTDCCGTCGVICVTSAKTIAFPRH